MVPWGDVGAFPPAIWSAVVRHAGLLVTGGEEGPCPVEEDGCVWARGVALRDLSAVALDPARYRTEIDRLVGEQFLIEVQTIAAI